MALEVLVWAIATPVQRLYAWLQRHVRILHVVFAWAIAVVIMRRLLEHTAAWPSIWLRILGILLFFLLPMAAGMIALAWFSARGLRRQSAGLILIVGAAFTAPDTHAQANPGIEAAREGGVVIVCRHALTDPADENEATLRYDDPTTQRLLSPAGERQSTDLGRAFTALGIRITQVIASPMDRARRTAELAFGETTQDSLWHTRGNNYGGPRRDARAAVLGAPVYQGVRIIVSHIGTISSNLPSARNALGEGDCIVVRPRGGDQHEVIAVVAWSAWMQAAGLAH